MNVPKLVYIYQDWADITFCTNDECLSKRRCLRHMGKPELVKPFASYSKFENNPRFDDCEYFYPIDKDFPKQLLKG